MTRKHFIRIAAALNATKPFMTSTSGRLNAAVHDQWMQTVLTMAEACAEFNGMFDRDRFIAACKGE